MWRGWGPSPFRGGAGPRTSDMARSSVPSPPDRSWARDNGAMPPGQDLLRVALAQINPTVGDIDGNARKIAERIAQAREQGAGLVVFPELALSG